jgi:hypothetical protein
MVNGKRNMIGLVRCSNSSRNGFQKNLKRTSFREEKVKQSATEIQYLFHVAGGEGLDISFTTFVRLRPSPNSTAHISLYSLE